jgi:hypothetical protein
VLAGAATITVAAAPPSFQALKWSVPGSEMEVLSRQPEHCLEYAKTDKPLVDAGAALFNTPNLLGGQAAKAGLSCASCHVNGHDNPHFLLNGLSSDPGTADVSSSFFSEARGNARFDAVKIPDLAMPGKISRDAKDGTLEPFIRDLIVEEFSGQEPSKATLDALATYVRAVRTCDVDGDAPLSLQNQLSLLDKAMGGAELMATRGDFRAARVLLAGARHQLGLINERYVGRRLAPQRKKLLALSNTFREANEASDDALADALLQAFAAYTNARLYEDLQRTERHSLYNPALLAKHFKP